MPCAAPAVDGVGLRSCARPIGSRSCCAAVAELALGTIHRSDVSQRPRRSPSPPRLSRSRLRSRARMSGEPTGAPIGYERLWASCLARSRRRWPLGRQALTATRRLLGSRTWSAAARFGASASAGPLRRPRATSPRPWIGSRRGRATFGSSGSGLGSADHCARPVRSPARAPWTTCRQSAGPGVAGRVRCGGWKTTRFSPL